MFHCGEIVMQHIIEGSHKTLKNLTISKSFYGNPLMKEEANSRDIPDLLKLETLVIHAPLNEFISSIVKLPCGDLKNLDISVRDKGYEFDGLHFNKLFCLLGLPPHLRRVSGLEFSSSVTLEPNYS